jgi:hypothetical protein
MVERAESGAWHGAAHSSDWSKLKMKMIFIFPVLS